MDCFLIIPDPTNEENVEQLERRINESFTHKYQLRGKVGWVVAHQQKSTTVQIWETLQSPNEPNVVGFVTKLREWRGLYDPGLWESLRSWGDYK